MIMEMEMDTSLREPVLVFQITRSTASSTLALSMSAPPQESVPSNRIPTPFPTLCSTQGGEFMAGISKKRAELEPEAEDIFLQKKLLTMVLGAVEEISLIVCRNVGDDGCIPPGDWQCPNCQDKDDLSKPIIQFRKKQSVATQKETTMMGKNDLDSTDILVSSSCNAEEGRTPSSLRPKELLFYKRSRFRGGSRKGSENTTNDLKHSITGGQVPEGRSVDSTAPVHASDTFCSVLNDERPSDSRAKTKDAAEGSAGDTKLHQVRFEEPNRLPMGSARKQRLRMLCARQKARIALSKGSKATELQVGPIATERGSFKRKHMLSKNKPAGLMKRKAEQTLRLGGVFLLSDAIKAFATRDHTSEAKSDHSVKESSPENESSSEGTISN